MLYLKSYFMHMANTASVEEFILSLGMITDKYQDSCSQFHSRCNGQHFPELPLQLRNRGCYFASKVSEHSRVGKAEINFLANFRGGTFWDFFFFPHGVSVFTTFTPKLHMYFLFSFSSLSVSC